MSTPRIQKVIAVVWPSFLLAGVATIVFFAVFDPHELLAPTWFPDVSRLGIYSIGFFLFWLLTASTSLLTCFFQRPLNKFNKQ